METSCGGRQWQTSGSPVAVPAISCSAVHWQYWQHTHVNCEHRDYCYIELPSVRFREIKLLSCCLLDIWPHPQTFVSLPPLPIYFVNSNTKRPLPFVSQISSIELSEFKDYQRL